MGLIFSRRNQVGEELDEELNKDMNRLHVLENNMNRLHKCNIKNDKLTEQNLILKEQKKQLIQELKQHMRNNQAFQNYIQYTIEVQIPHSVRTRNRPNGGKRTKRKRYA